MTTSRPLPCLPLIQSSTTEFRGKLNLKDVIKKISSYSKNDMISTNTFAIGGFIGNLKICPHGKTAKTEHPEKICTVFLCLKIDKEIPNYSVRYSINGNRLWQSCIHPVSFFRNSMAGLDVDHLELKQHPLIPFCIVLGHDIMVGKAARADWLYTLDNRLENIHVHSKCSGDIKLVLKQEIDHDLEPPPFKKRKAHKFPPEPIKIVKAILRTASPVFAEIFRSNEANRREKRIQMVEIPAKSYKDMEDFAYFINTHKLPKGCNPRNLVHLAHLYEMHELFWQSINQMVNELKVNNFVETVQLFNIHEIEDLFEIVVQFGKNNLVKLKARDDFKRLSHSFRFMLAASSSSL